MLYNISMLVFLGHKLQLVPFNCNTQGRVFPFQFKPPYKSFLKMTHCSFIIDIYSQQTNKKIFRSILRHVTQTGDNVCSKAAIEKISLSWSISLAYGHTPFIHKASVFSFQPLSRIKLRVMLKKKQKTMLISRLLCSKCV